MLDWPSIPPEEHDSILFAVLESAVHDVGLGDENVEEIYSFFINTIPIRGAKVSCSYHLLFDNAHSWYRSAAEIRVLTPRRLFGATWARAPTLSLGKEFIILMPSPRSTESGKRLRRFLQFSEKGVLRSWGAHSEIFGPIDATSVDGAIGFRRHSFLGEQASSVPGTIRKRHRSARGTYFQPALPHKCDFAVFF